VSQFLTYLYQSAKPQHREQVAGRIQAAADATGTDISEFTRLTRSEATDNLSVQNDDGTFNGTVVSNDGRQETRYRNATRTASGAIEGGTQHTQSAAFWDAHDEAVSHGMYNVFHDTYQNDPNGSQWSADLGHFEAGNPSYSAVPMSEEAAEVLVGMNTMPNTPPNSWTHLDLVKAIENNQVIWSNGQYEAA